MAAELQPVTSKTISHVGYDKDSKVMTVRFHHGGEYEYPNVPEGVHQAFVEAPSIGKHFHSHVRSQYSGKKVTQPA